MLSTLAAEMTDCLQQRLAPNHVGVEDESWKHEGHAGANGTGFGTHFRVRIRSARFAGLSRLARHRLVYEALDDFITERGVHALAIEASE